MSEVLSPFGILLLWKGSTSTCYNAITVNTIVDKCFAMYELLRRLLQGTLPSEYSANSCSFSILKNFLSTSIVRSRKTIRPKLHTHAGLSSSLALLVCCTDELLSQGFAQTGKRTGVIPDATFS